MGLSHSVSVLPVHGIYGNNPLLAEFADIHAINQLSVGNGFAQRAFAQPPKFGGIAESQQSIEGSFYRRAMFPQFVTGQVQFVSPDNAVTAHIHRHTAEQREVIFQSGKTGSFSNKGFTSYSFVTPSLNWTLSRKSGSGETFFIL